MSWRRGDVVDRSLQLRGQRRPWTTRRSVAVAAIGLALAAIALCVAEVTCTPALAVAGAVVVLGVLVASEAGNGRGPGTALLTVRLVIALVGVVAVALEAM